ncbi:MAG: metallophosphoesterase, partial [Thermoproteota archaeon]|nr:metallophosphoesterase [Thermoproteota archaeon]
MRLVQLSDLHIGGAYFKQDIFDTIVDEVNNNLKPDAILITGDLTDDGLISQFEHARIEINKLIEKCDNVLILPGNHDYRHTGYLVFKKFFSSYSSNVCELGDKAIIITLATARPD